MKIKLSIDDRGVAKARRIAAARGTSLNQLIGDCLEDPTRQGDTLDVLEELDAMWSEGAGRSHGPRARDELYDRS